MGFIKTLFTQVSGLCNDTLDSVSNTGRTARQTIRVLDNEIKKAEDSVAEVLAELKLIEYQRDEAQTNAANWHAMAVEAKEKKEVELMQEAVEKEVQADDLVSTYTTQIAKLSPMASNLKARLSDLRRKKQQAEHTVDILAARENVAKAETRAIKILGNIGKTNPNPVDFDGLEKEVVRTETKAQAYSELHAESNQLDAKKAALIYNEAVRKKLDALNFN